MNLFLVRRLDRAETRGDEARKAPGLRAGGCGRDGSDRPGLGARLAGRAGYHGHY